MQSLAHHFTTEAYNSAWANHRLLRACCELTAEEFAAKRTSFFPTIKATLNHILTVDWYYLETLERSLAGLPPHENPGRHYEPEEPFAPARPRRRAHARTAPHLLCAGLDDSPHGRRGHAAQAGEHATCAAHPCSPSAQIPTAARRTECSRPRVKPPRSTSSTARERTCVRRIRPSSGSPSGDLVLAQNAREGARLKTSREADSVLDLAPTPRAGRPDGSATRAPAQAAALGLPALLGADTTPRRIARRDRGVIFS